MNKQEQGRQNRKKGQSFELKTRKDLEDEGWTVLKNPNDVIDGKFTKAKAKFNPFTHQVMMMTGGFPDFIIWDQSNIILGVECKTNGYLSQEEKAKCDFLLKNKILHEILIYSKKGITKHELAT